MRATSICPLLITMGLTLVGWAQEPVLRVIDIKSRSSAAALMDHRRVGDTKWYPAYVGTTGIVRDHFKTSPETVAALEFFIGGRVGVNKDTEIEIVTDRSVAATGLSVQRIVLVNGALWMKSNAHELRKPLEIQTSGGSMAIKGTEFTLESHPDATSLSVLEGSVEVKDAQQKLLGLAQPGDVYKLAQTQDPVVEHKDVNVLRSELEQLYGDLQSMQGEIQGVRQGMQNVEKGINVLFDFANRNKVHLAPPYQEAILSETVSTGAQGLQPSAAVTALSLFQWQPYNQADGYVIFVSDQSDFKNLLFSARTRDAQAVYPATARPLAPGAYYWRVVPVDAQDQPLTGATQATFQIKHPG